MTQMCLSLVSRSVSTPDFEHCTMDQFWWWKANLLGGGIQTTTQREVWRPLHLGRNILPIDPDRRRTSKLEFASHVLIPNKHFLNLGNHAFCGQNILDELYCCRMRRAFRHIQPFNFHFSVPRYSRSRRGRPR